MINPGDGRMGRPLHHLVPVVLKHGWPGAGPISSGRSLVVQILERKLHLRVARLPDASRALSGQEWKRTIEGSAPRARTWSTVSVTITVLLRPEAPDEEGGLDPALREELELLGEDA